MCVVCLYIYSLSLPEERLLYTMKRYRCQPEAWQVAKSLGLRWLLAACGIAAQSDSHWWGPTAPCMNRVPEGTLHIADDDSLHTITAYTCNCIAFLLSNSLSPE